jgi:hypothetical protein
VQGQGKGERGQNRQQSHYRLPPPTGSAEQQPLGANFKTNGQPPRAPTGPTCSGGLSPTALFNGSLQRLSLTAASSGSLQQRPLTAISNGYLQRLSLTRGDLLGVLEQPVCVGVARPEKLGRHPGDAAHLLRKEQLERAVGERAVR